ncbi:MAG: ferrochelatase [Desulfobulbaceae bacterium BRH_c16a]|nr:MAG: ferrochelatase [Desulfobulbaceae bacterium BRH_c16a]
MKDSKKGVVLLNMGGPDTLEDVRPFLFNLFCDRQIIRLGPAFMQRPLAWLIARRRAPKSRAIYAKIGGGSPLKSITLQQADALQKALSTEGNHLVAIAMRYWYPFADQALQALLRQGVDRIIVLPLYPHYSKATTGSSLHHFRESLERLAPGLPISIISSWQTQPSYIRAVAENITKGLQTFADREVTILYSAHSLPVSFIREGDPYVDHITETIEAIEKLTGRKGKLCYQSRSGPVEWLSPSTQETIERLAEAGCRNILMVPISFVSDHIETLYEISILFKERAEQLGMYLHACDSLNTHPTFIQGLRELVCSVPENAASEPVAL